MPLTVCVPNKFHCGIVLDALEAGCHVFCEKPPAISPEEAGQMEERALRQENFFPMDFISGQASRLVS